MANRPNILFLMTDQHNPHIAGFEGDSIVDTGALDALASGSVAFDGAYCQAPLCAPSRMSMLTGKWATNCSAYDNDGVIFRSIRLFPPAWRRLGIPRPWLAKRISVAPII